MGSDRFGPAKDAVARAWKGAFLQTLAAHLLEHERHDRRIPLLLSGGMDSGTILAGLLTLGEHPECFTFRIGDVDHPDVAVARAMTARHELPLTIVDLPRDEASLVADVRAVCAILGVSGADVRKAAVQCAQPILHLAGALSAAGHERAFVGTGGIVEDNRKVHVILGAQGEEAARSYRRSTLFGVGNATEAMKRVALYRGVRLLEPFSAEPIAEHGLSLSLAEINRPVKKGIAWRAFPDFWHGFWRENSPLQVNSRIREWHDTLLASPHNRAGAKAVVAVYRALLVQGPSSDAEPPAGEDDDGDE